MIKVVIPKDKKITVKIPKTVITQKQIEEILEKLPALNGSAKINEHNLSAESHEDIRNLISAEKNRAQAEEDLKADKSTTYTKSEVDSKISAIPTPDVSAQITEHNTSETAHSDIRTALSSKVDKVTGKSLIADTEITRLASVSNVDISGKVDKVTGKGLSTEDYTTAEKTKLSGIETGAQVNPDLTPYAKTTDVNTALSTKADTTALTSHTSNTSNPHSTTKAQVGLGNVANVDTTSTANITDSADKRFCTDAQKTVIGNTSGINTGDETQASIITKIGYTPLAPNGNGSELTGLSAKNLKVNLATNVLVFTSANQSISASTWTKINLSAENTDTLNEYNPSTVKFIPSITQSALLSFIGAMSTVAYLSFAIYKNGVSDKQYPSYNSGINLTIPYIFTAGAEYEFYIQSNVANTLNIYANITIRTLGV